MAYQRLIDKFSAAYDIYGVYLHDSGRIIPLNQKNPRGIMVLRENQNKLLNEGIAELQFQKILFGAIITQTKTNSQLVLLASHERIKILAKHWKRVYPAIIKTLPIEEIVEEEKPVTKIARKASQMNQLFDEMISYYQKE